MRDIHISYGNKLLGLALLAAILLSVIGIAYAATPNPGHLYSETSGGVVQGDLLYGSGTDVFSKLVKDANATRYLSNQGTSNNPSWNQVNLANGVTGLLPNANLANGAVANLSGTNTGDQTISDATITTTDITTNNFTTAKHGFVPKGTNVGNYLKDDGTWAAVAGGGDMVLASIQTVTGAKTFNDTKFFLRNVAGTFNASFLNTNTADRIYTLVDRSAALGNDLNAVSVADQSVAAATSALLTGSLITVPAGKLRIGTVFKWRLALSKTAAGTAANTFFVRVGTACTVADTARLTFAMPVGTAAADVGQIDITATVRGPLSASGIMQGHLSLNHNLAATGLSTIGVNVNATSAAFDVTTAALCVSLSVTTAASTVLTFQQVVTEVLNL